MVYVLFAIRTQCLPALSSLKAPTVLVLDTLHILRSLMARCGLVQATSLQEDSATSAQLERRARLKKSGTRKRKDMHESMPYSTILPGLDSRMSLPFPSCCSSIYEQHQTQNFPCFHLGAWERVECLTCGVNKDVIEDWETSSMCCV